MNIMVFDVPAESGGALSILHSFYEQAINYDDKNTKWVFVLGKANLEPTENVSILRFPWVKKSWFHRLYFDYFIAPRLVSEGKINKIISLQNIIIPRVKGIEQTVYIHQSLPFVDYQFRFREDKKLWIYQNLIGSKIIRSIKKADSVIVQTRWMKEACIDKTSVKREKIEVKTPEVDIKVEGMFEENPYSKRTFFYPAGASLYKNHEIIVNVCDRLTKEGFTGFRIIFTLRGNENKHTNDLYRKVKSLDLPIEFVGPITRDEVYDYYTKTTLIFPSYIETLGLPLLEARLHNTPILASDCPFSREILNDYKRAMFFDPFNTKELYSILLELISN